MYRRDSKKPMLSRKISGKDYQRQPVSSPDRFVEGITRNHHSALQRDL
jgi:hypothetical protein